MKRVLSVIIVALMLASALTVGASAITDTEWSALEFTLINQTMNGYTLTGDDALGAGMFCMRGFAVSPDGKYMFGGYLNPGGSSAVEMFDTATGKLAGTYVHVQSDAGISYPKGLACDNRGYLYVGLAWRQNYGTADFAIVDYNTKDPETGYLKRLSTMQIVKTSEARDNTGVKTGINGVTVENYNGNYYMYVVVNYDVDYLYRFNVNDPAAPVLDTTFGNNGRIDLQGAPYSLTEGNYLDVDVDGLIYMGYTSASGAGMIVLSADGKTVINKVEQTKGYGVAVYGDYVLVTTQASGTVCVYNKATLALVATLTLTDKNVQTPCTDLYYIGVNSLCNVAVVDDILYLADQAANASGYDQVIVAGLTAAAKTVVDTRKNTIGTAVAAANTTSTPDTTSSPDTTAAPGDTTAAPAGDTTAAPAGDTTAAPAGDTTAAPAGDTTADPGNQGGCGSYAMLAPIAAVITLAGAVIVKKKKF